VTGKPGPSASRLAARIVAGKDGWVRHRNGMAERCFDGGIRMGVEPSGDLWRVSVSLAGTFVPLWEAADESEAFSMAATAAASHAGTAAWRRSELSGSEDIGDGLRVAVLKTAGNPMAKAQVSRIDGGAVVGSYIFTRTEWPADFLLGTSTLNGSVMLDEGMRGKGICRKFYDAVERIAGLPIVPHGRNGMPGTLSEPAERFWSKRTAERKVIGYGDPGLAERSERLAKATEVITAENECFLDAGFAVAVAMQTGWTVKGVVLRQGDDADRRVPGDAWCVDDKGLAFTSVGHMRETSFMPAAEDPELQVVDFDPEKLREALEIPRLVGFFEKRSDFGKLVPQAAAVLGRHGVQLPHSEPEPDGRTPGSA